MTPTPTPTTPLGRLTAWWLRILAAPGAEPSHRDRERGDVPGWVMITLMTAGLVIALWAVAGERLAALFTQAMNAVTQVL